MQRVENALRMKDEQFKRILGTTKAVFQQMLTVLQLAYSFAHTKGGKPGDLSSGNKSSSHSKYWREYRTMEHIAVDYGVDKGTVCRSIQWVEGLMIGVILYADSGYQGVAKVHANSVIPINRKKNKELSEEEKCFNHKLSSKRVAVEHTNVKIKTFKIMAHPYRNKRRRHLLRITLICSIINAETQT